MKKKFSLVANVQVASLYADPAHTEQSRIVREMAERELQTRIALVELDRAERFVTNADLWDGFLLKSLNPDLQVDVPQSVANGATRPELQAKNVVGVYRTPEAHARELLFKEIKRQLAIDNMCYFMFEAQR